MRGSTARRQLLVSLGLGVIAGSIAAGLGAGLSAILIGWDVAALTFVTWVWTTVWRLDPGATSRHASRDDPTRDVADLVILGSAIVSVAAVGAILFEAGNASSGKGLRVTLALASIFASWLLVHTVFTLKYARGYYGGAPGGIDFNESDPPQYSDFAYLSFTIGMTFQVSDTDIGSKEIRRTALKHALIAFPLVALILASAVNLVAGLAK